MQIIIRLGNLTQNSTIKIDDEKSIFLVNGQPQNVNIDEFVMRLQAIVASWDFEMMDNSVADGSWYEINMKVGNKTRKYVGKNAFPTNYVDFIDLINEVLVW